MPHGQGAPGLEEDIAPKYIATRLVGDNLQLAIAAVKIVVFHLCKGVAKRIMAGANSQSLAAIGTQDGPGAKVVVIYAVMVGSAIFSI